ncbi:MAG: VCBS repeat-containing protein [Phycisphaerae bacterium]|nr:VCBS repeat-containing protein [Phycisphaerae bacterium]
MNGDGYNDILVGARQAPDRKSNGSAYLFLGNTKEDMDAVCDYVFRGEEASNEMGYSVDLFDIDNDGFSDVVVGARYAKYGRGTVYVWWGGKDFDGNRPADIVLQGEPLSHMGGDDLIIGDVNNDGYIDALLGAQGGGNGNAFLYFGPFATEDLQDKIKAQQEIVKEVEQELSDPKQKLNEVRKFVPSSVDLQGAFEGLPENLLKFLTPGLEQLHDEMVASLKDDSFILRDGIRKNTIATADSQLSPYMRRRPRGGLLERPRPAALDGRRSPSSRLQESVPDGMIHCDELNIDRRIPVGTTAACKQGQSNDS